MIPDPSTKTHLRAYSQVLQLHPENEAEHKAYKICFFSIADVGSCSCCNANPREAGGLALVCPKGLSNKLLWNISSWMASLSLAQLE